MKKFILIYFVFNWCFFSLFASGFVDSQDGFVYLTVARRIYYDHTFEVPPGKYPQENTFIPVIPGKGGERYTSTGLGYSLSLIPAVIIEDLFLKQAKTSPHLNFPLNNDWPVLLFASMTNAFWGALLVTVLYLYLRSFSLSHQQAILLGFGLTLSTNLVIYAKHTFAHMMFVSLLTLCFYLMRRYAQTKQRYWIFYTGISFGLLVLSYNPSFILTIPALGIYYLLLTKAKLSIEYFKQLVTNLVLGLLGLAPFWLIYTTYNQIRYAGSLSSGYNGVGGVPGIKVPYLYIIVEGLWGIILSPGRSIFLYSPILLILVIFWFKLKKQYLAEIVSFLVLFLTFWFVIATLHLGSGAPVWHGESSWGPRYMLVVLPLAIVLISLIYQQLSKKAKWLIFYPLVLVGFYVQFLGILIPYQNKLTGFVWNLEFPDRYETSLEYTNQIPRFSPLYTMSKELVKRIKALPRLYDHGHYNLRLFDGFDYPFDLGYTTWREVLPLAQIKFDNHLNYPVRELTLQLKNHPIRPISSYSAELSLRLNQQPVGNEKVIIPIETEKEISFAVTDDMLKDKDNLLEIKSNLIGTDSARLKGEQVLFLQIFRVNQEPQNITSLDYPYVSRISQALANVKYSYWGDQQQDPWAIWHMHSGIFEDTPDFWWLRPLHYWDLPKDFFAGLLGFHLTALGSTGFLILRSFKSKP